MLMAKKIIIGIVAFIAILVLAGFLMPGQVHVERSVVINATPAQIFPHVCDFEKNTAWSPWASRDPEIKNSFIGTPCTVDHKNEWKSEHPEVGNGAQWITKIDKDKRMETKLDFGDNGQADAFFSLAPEGEGTKVTWGFDMDAGMNPIARWMGLFMENFIGPDYEKGLANLKAQV